MKTNLAGIVLDCNREAQQAFRTTSIKGKSLRELVHPEDQAAFAARWDEISNAAGAVRAVSCFQGVDSVLRLAWSAKRAPDRDEVYAMLMPLPDAGEHSPKRLDDPAQLLRGILDHCNLSLIVVDLDGRYVVHDGKAVAAIAPSSPCKLRNLRKVRVIRQERQIVLQYDCRNPNVICRNGCALSA